MLKLPKKTAFLTIALFLIFSAVSCTSNTKEGLVNWLYDWDEASSEAQAENKPIMIDFYTDWCPGCQELDSKTFSDEELSAFLNTSFICLKSNTNESELYNSFDNIEYVPTIVFASPDGTEIDRIVGYLSANAFYQAAQEVLSQWEP